VGGLFIVENSLHGSGLGNCRLPNETQTGQSIPATRQLIRPHNASVEKIQTMELSVRMGKDVFVIREEGYKPLSHPGWQVRGPNRGTIQLGNSHNFAFHADKDHICMVHTLTLG
jgi:hypothetical protein